MDSNHQLTGYEPVAPPLNYGNKCREYMLPFHMPLCSGVGCPPALPTLPSSTGEVSGAFTKVAAHLLGLTLPHSYSVSFGDGVS